MVAHLPLSRSLQQVLAATPPAPGPPVDIEAIQTATLLPRTVARRSVELARASGLAHVVLRHPSRPHMLRVQYTRTARGSALLQAIGVSATRPHAAGVALPALCPSAVHVLQLLPGPCERGRYPVHLSRAAALSPRATRRLLRALRLQGFADLDDPHLRRGRWRCTARGHAIAEALIR